MLNLFQYFITSIIKKKMHFLKRQNRIDFKQADVSILDYSK